MRSIIKSGVIAAAAACLVPLTAAQSQSAAKDIVLRNPSNSVHVRIHQCGKSRCGTVVWANAKAKADSARGGTPNLVGTELFREFHEVSPGDLASHVMPRFNAHRAIISATEQHCRR